MIRRLFLWLVSKRDLICEIERLRAELSRSAIVAETSELRADLAAEALNAQREWLKALAAVARFEYAQNTTAAESFKSGEKR